MRLHPEVLSEEQSAILPKLGAFSTANGFYLGGGTAVALQLGHRRSVDFDWFSRTGIGDPLVLAERARGFGLDVAAVRTAPGTLHGSIADVRISFFDYPYPDLAEPVEWSDCLVHLASLDDLACMKLAAVAQRGSRKDFIDLYAIAIQHRQIEDILGLYQRKYSNSEIAHVLVGLTYFDDADEEPSPVMLCEMPWDDIKGQFEEWAKALAR